MKYKTVKQKIQKRKLSEIEKTPKELMERTKKAMTLLEELQTQSRAHSTTDLMNELCAIRKGYAPCDQCEVIIDKEEMLDYYGNLNNNL